MEFIEAALPLPVDGMLFDFFDDQEAGAYTRPLPSST